MEITISRVEYQETEKRVMVSVSHREQQPNGTWHSVVVTVFLDWNDSYAEIQRLALEKANAFLLHVATV